MSKISLLLHNIRSTHNVGSILRSADGFGIDTVYFSGYTPYPEQENDTRLIHLREKLTRQIYKTSLGAEKSVKQKAIQDPLELIASLKQQGLIVLALEQADRSIMLDNFDRPQNDLLLILGEEVNGVPKELLEICDKVLEIPMHGKKESFNVAISAAIAMYALSRK